MHQPSSTVILMGSRRNIVLIGMPGAGKSTVGVLLAKRTRRDFIDTDVLIQTAQGRSLQQIVDQDGYQALCRIEASLILGLRVENHVIATGGSAVYSEEAMSHLEPNGVTVFLQVDLATLQRRIDDLDTRGIARRPGQSLGDLYAERAPLYAEYADLTVDCTHLDQEQACRRIWQALESMLSTF